MAKPFLNNESKAALSAAVSAVEAASSAELVIAVRPRTGSYLHADLGFGILVGFAALAVLLFSPWIFAPVWVLVDPAPDRRPRGARGLAERAPAAGVHAGARAPAAGRGRGPVHFRRAARPWHDRTDGHPPLRLRPRARGGLRGRLRGRGARRHGRLAARAGRDRAGGPRTRRMESRWRRGSAPSPPFWAPPWRGARTTSTSCRTRCADREVFRSGRSAVSSRFLGFLAFLLLPAAAFARAGGGQSYSGGSSGGGGGGDGGGLIFLVIRLLFWLIFHHPLIGIPLTIVLVYAFIQYQKRTGAARLPALGLGAAPEARLRLAAGLARSGRPAHARSRVLGRPLRGLRLRPLRPRPRGALQRAGPRGALALPLPGGPRPARPAPAGGRAGLGGGDRRHAGRRAVDPAGRQRRAGRAGTAGRRARW